MKGLSISTRSFIHEPDGAPENWQGAADNDYSTIVLMRGRTTPTRYLGSLAQWTTSQWHSWLLPASQTLIHLAGFRNHLVDKSLVAFYDVGVAAAIENILKRTRSEILSCLRSRGRLTVEELATALGVSKVCIRRHLGLLGRDQLIAYDVEKQDRGRPSHVYYLTEKSESLFPTGYAAFAQGMLKQIGRQFGESAIQAVIGGYAEEAITTIRYELEHRSGEARLHGFVALLNRSGYDAQVAVLEHGGYIVEQRNCPVRALAFAHRQICDEELRLYRDILDVEVRRECRIAGGSSSCIYKVFLPHEQTGIQLQGKASLEH